LEKKNNLLRVPAKI